MIKSLKEFYQSINQLQIGGYNPPIKLYCNGEQFFVKEVMLKNNEIDGTFCNIELHSRRSSLKDELNDLVEFVEKNFDAEDMKVLNKGQRTYRVENIDPDSSKRVQGYLTRVQVLKVPPDTVLDSGRTVKDEEAYYKTEDEVASEDEKEEEEVELTTQQKANKLLQYTKRDWNQELRGKTFKSDDKTLETITNVVYRGMIYKWVIEYESEDKSEWEDYLPVVLGMAKGEDWYKPEYDLILNNKKFRPRK